MVWVLVTSTTIKGGYDVLLRRRDCCCCCASLATHRLEVNSIWLPAACMFNCSHSDTGCGMLVWMFGLLYKAISVLRMSRFRVIHAVSWGWVDTRTITCGATRHVLIYYILNPLDHRRPSIFYLSCASHLKSCLQLVFCCIICLHANFLVSILVRYAQ